MKTADFWKTVNIGDIVQDNRSTTVEILEIPHGRTFHGVSSDGDWSCFWLKSKFTKRRSKGGKRMKRGRKPNTQGPYYEATVLKRIPLSRLAQIEAILQEAKKQIAPKQE